MVILFVTGVASITGQTIMDKKNYNKLTAEEKRVILNKGTEMPFTGTYNDFYEKGLYVCKQCNAPLFRSDDKFRSECGWPSFDDEIEGAVERRVDADGVRTEILCANCGAHLGHVFFGERFTDKNLRHCVNSISLTFIPAAQVNRTQKAKAYFAGGCFWGVEHLFEQKQGVVSAVSGYMGGDLKNPSYQDVLRGTTGHLEAVEVTYDPGKVSYEELARYFFEIHDPTQINGQGPDIGEQYKSAVFVSSDTEEKTVRKLIGILRNKGYDVATKVIKAGRFWKAEEYHQDYYDRKKQEPYCHFYQKRF
ncbi:bifunctional methionine sulfoxide reductase B/A protein [bacterium]|nr:bifunctional methionine sulfoxide reductase B/A protein [bacterium]